MVNEVFGWTCPERHVYKDARGGRPAAEAARLMHQDANALVARTRDA